MFILARDYCSLPKSQIAADSEIPSSTERVEILMSHLPRVLCFGRNLQIQIEWHRLWYIRHTSPLPHLVLLTNMAENSSSLLITDSDRLFSRHLQSFAFSRTANPHNTELPWYGIWNHCLQVVVRGTPTLFVAPQYPLRFFKDEDEDPMQPETDIDGVHPDFENKDPRLTVEVVLKSNVADEETETETETAADNSDDPVREFDSGLAEELEDEYEEADTSMASNATISSSGTSTRITDFATIFISVRSVTGRTILYGGWKVMSFRVPLITEIKRFPSRSLSDAALDSALETKLREARGDAVVQALHLFKGSREQKYVVLLATSGPYWSHVGLTRREALDSHDYLRLLKGVLHSDRPSLSQTLKWSDPPARLDTPVSDRRLEELREYLVDFAAQRSPADANPVAVAQPIPAKTAPVVAARPTLTNTAPAVVARPTPADAASLGLRLLRSLLRFLMWTILVIILAFASGIVSITYD